MNLRFGTVFALCLACLPAAAHAWPVVPLPPGSSGETVSENLDYNGIPMRASRFRTSRKMEAVLDFYEKRWGKDQHLTHHERGVIIGHPEGGYYVTVALNPVGTGTEGTIGIMKIPTDAAQPELAKGFYRPAGTEVLSDIGHRDTPGQTRTIVMRNKLSPYSNLQSFARRFGGDGWKGAAEGACIPSSSACVIRFEKASEGRMVMTFSREPQSDTGIVVNVE